MTKFDKMVADLKAGIKQDENAELIAATRNIMIRVEEALKDVPLTSAHREQVFAIVNQAFSDANLPLNQRLNMQPGDDKATTLVGFCTTGKYPEAAYNVSVHKEGVGLTLYLWQTPKDGNLRS